MFRGDHLNVLQNFSAFYFGIFKSLPTRTATGVEIFSFLNSFLEEKNYHRTTALTDGAMAISAIINGAYSVLKNIAQKPFLWSLHDA